MTPAQVPDYLGLKGDTSRQHPRCPGDRGEDRGEAAPGVRLARRRARGGRPRSRARSARTCATHAGEALREPRASRRSRATCRSTSTSTSVPFGRFRSRRGCRGLRRATVHLAPGARARARGLACAGVSVRAADRRGHVARAAGGARRDDAGRDRADAAVRADPTVSAATCAVSTGESALEAVAEWASADAGWLGVALDDGGRVALRRPTLTSRSPRTGLSPSCRPTRRSDRCGALLARGRDRRRRREGAPRRRCARPTESRRCDTSFDAVESERLFDCGLAAYLLESNRSSYDLPALYGGLPRARRLPHAPDEAPAAALQAQARG